MLFVRRRQQDWIILNNDLDRTLLHFYFIFLERNILFVHIINYAIWGFILGQTLVLLVNAHKHKLLVVLLDKNFLDINDPTKKSSPLIENNCANYLVKYFIRDFMSVFVNIKMFNLSQWVYRVYRVFEVRCSPLESWKLAYR